MMPYTYPGDSMFPLRTAYPSIWEIQDIKCRKCGTTVRPSMSRGALFALELHDQLMGHNYSAVNQQRDNDLADYIDYG